MNKYGFVYALYNVAHRGLYKIGCTEKAPHARAEELSRGTGVPSEFHVAAYIECQGFQQVEHDIHLALAPFRSNAKREFFAAPPDLIARCMFHHPRMLTWTDNYFFEFVQQDMSRTADPYAVRLAA